VIKAASLLQSSVSHDPSEIILCKKIIVILTIKDCKNATVQNC